MNNYFEIAEYVENFIKNISIVNIDNFFIKNGVLENNKIILDTSGIVYGPYYSISKGEYVVEINGIDINHLDFDVVDSEGNKEISNIVIENNRIKYNVIFEDDSDNVEFRFYNNGSKRSEIENISVKFNNYIINKNNNFLVTKEIYSPSTIQYYKPLRGKFIFIKRVIRKLCKFLLEDNFKEISLFNGDVKRVVNSLVKNINEQSKKLIEEEVLNSKNRDTLIVLLKKIERIDMEMKKNEKIEQTINELSKKSLEQEVLISKNQDILTNLLNKIEDYDKEIKKYKEEVERLEDENKLLKEENEYLKRLV